MSELRQLQQSFMGYVLGQSSDILQQVESTPVLSAQGRLDIYASAYKLRLKEAISTDYKVLHSYLGDEQFDEVMEAYIADNPSHTTNLRYYSINMTRLLKEDKPFSKLPVLSEIALIEASFANSFDAEDGAIVTMEALANLAAESWPTLHFAFVKSAQIIELNFNSFAIWQALSDDDSPPELRKMEQQTEWLMWRRSDLISYYRPLQASEATALKLALQGETFAVICEALLNFFDEDETPMKAVSYLQSWIEEEMVGQLHDH